MLFCPEVFICGSFREAVGTKKYGYRNYCDRDSLSRFIKTRRKVRTKLTSWITRENSSSRRRRTTPELSAKLVPGKFYGIRKRSCDFRESPRRAIFSLRTFNIHDAQDGTARITQFVKMLRSKSCVTTK